MGPGRRQVGEVVPHARGLCWGRFPNTEVDQGSTVPHIAHTQVAQGPDTPGPCTGCSWGCTDRKQPRYGWKVLENQSQSEFLKTEGSGMVAMQAYIILAWRSGEAEAGRLLYEVSLGNIARLF